MKNGLLICFILLVSLHAFALQDSTKSVSHPVYWTPRLVLGLQAAPFVEVGISRLGLSNGFPWSTWCFYGSIEVNFTQFRGTPTSSYALKAGYESSWGIYMGGVEVKWLTDVERSIFLCTPKVGLSLFGAFNVPYGYHIPKEISEFQALTRHQISIVLNLNRKLTKDIFK